MRFVSDIYEHPHLTYSEVWAKDAHNRSGATRFVAAMGVLSVVTISSIAAVQYAGYVDLLKTVGLIDRSVFGSNL
jgi:hypothetical protein